jgi:Ran GTPase-activating protein (RanGAP) involved in mRNA processing and transport
MAVQDDSSRASSSVGYQPPNVKLYQIDDEIMTRLAANDPDIEGLLARGYDARLLRDADITNNLGRAISKSTNLRRFKTYGEMCDTIDCQIFFAWLAHNRSIEHLEISSFNLTTKDIYQHLAPFFLHNARLRCIEITNVLDASKRIPSLIAALIHSGENRLQKINLSRSGIEDEKCAELIDALNKMTGLHNLLELDLGGNQLGRKSCVSISELIRNPVCRIQILGLSNSRISDECMGNLISGLATNTSIKVLDFWSRYLRTGWQVLFIFLSSPRCSIETLTALGGGISDESATSLGDSLAVNLKSLSISINEITSKGWRAVSNGLRGVSSTLVELILDECRMLCDEGAVAIFEALASNQTLKKLSLRYCEEITSNGWATCFRLLEDSQSALEELTFVSNNIDDEGANILANLLSKHMRTVRLLYLRYCDYVTADGWRAFADVLLPNSTSKLASLRLGYESDDDVENRMNDEAVLSFIAAISHNTSLVELNIGDVENVSQSSLDALVDSLCDKTSIASVCNSNHTLSIFQYTCDDETDHPSELDSLLELNENKDKAEVVREKMLTSSVINEGTVGYEFGSTPVAVFPSLMEWIGRDRLGYSAMHCLVQSFPSLLGHLTGPDADDSVLLESPRKLRKVE